MNNFDDCLEEVQADLAHSQCDGWLLYDFRRSNPLACKFLQIPPTTMLTRRFFYWIPKKGSPIKVVHAIEPNVLQHLPGHECQYHSRQALEKLLGEILADTSRIAMEYSPYGAIPYISKVDGGTLDLVRRFGCEVVSSGDFLQRFTSVWDASQLQTHLEAADVLAGTVDKTWRYITEHVLRDQHLTEYDVQQFMLSEFKTHDCVTDSPPICAVNTHSADPHYAVEKEHAVRIRPGDFILLDLWCKQDLSRAVYADIARVGVVGVAPTERQQEIFDVVKRARGVAFTLIKESFANKEPLSGYQVDECCRQSITKAGYGSYFIHRTGHNIDEDVHGEGANMDSYETFDSRVILPGTCFSIEPGIYLPDQFGVRLESDVYIHLDGTVQVTGGIQEEIACLLKEYV